MPGSALSQGEDDRYLDWADLAAIAARERWLAQARPNQVPPPGNWDTLLWMCGRGFGKTRCLVEWAWWEAWSFHGIRIHALAPTLSDVHKVVFAGESGFLAKIPPEMIADYVKQERRLILTNGSEITGFSTVEEADRLRGPQCHHLVFDEAAAADRPAGNLESAWKVASLGCRLPLPNGAPSRRIIATTPRPLPFFHRLTKDPRTRVISGSSHENLANMSAVMRREVLQHEGTVYGRQEIYGELIDTSEGAILPRPWFRLWPAEKKLPTFSFVLEIYDTAMSEEDYDVKKQETDPTASIVLGVFNTKAEFTPQELAKMGVRTPYAALLCDAWAERLGFPDLLDKARVQHRIKWGQKPARRADIVLIEDKASGRSLRQTMASWGVPAMPYNPGRMNKTMRAHAVAPTVRQGSFFVPESSVPHRKGQVRDWAEPFMQEVTSFRGPGSIPHDDLLDALTSGLIYLKDAGILLVEPDKKVIDFEEDLEQKRREAVKQMEREKAATEENPYG